MAVISIGDLLFYIEWSSKALFDAWHGTIENKEQIPLINSVNWHCGVPGGDDDGTINCCYFREHPDGIKGYSGFYANFPDSLNPKLSAIVGATTFEIGSTYLADNGYVDEGA